MTIRINLLRPQHFTTTPGEKIMIQAMLENAYRMGLAQGEQNMASGITARLNRQELKYWERRQADRRE